LSGGARAPLSVLLLHGQPGGARDWDRVVTALGSRARALAIDRPGWDGTTPATDLPGNAAAALAALDAHDVEHAIIVGHSLGAGVAAWLAAHHSERVQALVLAAPAANTASLTRTDHVLATPLVGSVASAALLSGAAAGLGYAPLRRAVARRLHLDEGHLRGLARRLSGPAAWRSFVAEQRALVRELPALDGLLGRISARTVIVAGAADHVVPATAARALATQISGAELVLLERAGHLLPQMHAEQLAEIIVGVGVGLHPAQRRGEGIEPSKRGAPPPCSF
jgi:pimeloyl-ACP methyl ester carboxylesterase